VQTMYHHFVAAHGALVCACGALAEMPADRGVRVPCGACELKIMVSSRTAVSPPAVVSQYVLMNVSYAPLGT